MAKELSPFEKAYADARSSGKKTFIFNGTSYAAQSKEEKADQDASSGRAVQANYAGQGRKDFDYTGPRDKFGIPGKIGNPTPSGPDSVDSSELGRNVSAALNATGTGGLLNGLRRGIAVGKAGNEMMEGRAAADAAKNAAKYASREEPVVETTITSSKSAPSLSLKPSKDIGVMDKFSDALRAVKQKVGRGGMSDEDIIGADTLDLSGKAMKRGGMVKRYANGGSVTATIGRYKQGGSINLSDCKVSTHTPGKKNSNW